MTALPIIEDLNLIDVRGGPSDVAEDGWFAGVRAGSRTGWYGPVSDAVAQLVHTTMATVTVGSNPWDHDVLSRRLYAQAESIGTMDALWAAGVVDCAVWDLHGLLIETPVATLLRAELGGADTAEASVAVYASWLGLDLSTSAGLDEAARVEAEGYWHCTKWGLRQTADAASTDTEAAQLAEIASALARQLIGDYALDAVGTWNPPLALAFAGHEAARPGRLRWVEDPLPAHDFAAYHHLATTGLPLGIGERIGPDLDLNHVITRSPLAACTIDIVGCGGLTRACQAVRTARTAGVPVYPHGRSLVPGIHLAAAAPDAVPAVEYRLQWEPKRQMKYASPWIVQSGFFPPISAPGLGAAPRKRVP